MAQGFAERLDPVRVLALGLTADRDSLLAKLHDELLNLAAIWLLGLQVLLQALEILDDRLGGRGIQLLECRFPTFDVLDRGRYREAFDSLFEVLDGGI